MAFSQDLGGEHLGFGGDLEPAHAVVWGSLNDVIELREGGIVFFSKFFPFEFEFEFEKSLLKVYNHDFLKTK